MPVVTIRPATADDANALTELMHGSAAYRGRYASILDGYAITPEQIAKDVFRVAEQYDARSGFYSLALAGEPELDLMFVADSAQGKGIGALLFRHMMGEARRRGVSVLKIVSHPPSVGFYQAMGATIIGTKPPTAKATWSRPILSLTI
ncbi:GNAT family N-acetyltransferase [uncultured Sphingomonas sp.]|uniref:GNAT family N-acetyltransferase n=1 Tax=uncultured Sphingomonas sp. TaxID=158754 RepID=UPI003748B67E